MPLLIAYIYFLHCYTAYTAYIAYAAYTAHAAYTTYTAKHCLHNGKNANIYCCMVRGLKYIGCNGIQKHYAVEGRMGWIIPLRKGPRKKHVFFQALPPHKHKHYINKTITICIGLPEFCSWQQPDLASVSGLNNISSENSFLPPPSLHIWYSCMRGKDTTGWLQKLLSFRYQKTKPNGQ